jgi:hypothetical protein
MARRDPTRRCPQRTHAIPTPLHRKRPLLPLLETPHQSQSRPGKPNPKQRHYVRSLTNHCRANTQHRNPTNIHPPRRTCQEPLGGTTGRRPGFRLPLAASWLSRGFRTNQGANLTLIADPEHLTGKDARTIDNGSQHNHPLPTAHCFARSRSAPASSSTKTPYHAPCKGVALGYRPVPARRWALRPRARRNSAATSRVAASAPSGNTCSASTREMPATLAASSRARSMPPP